MYHSSPSPKHPLPLRRQLWVSPVGVQALLLHPTPWEWNIPPNHPLECGISYQQSSLLSGSLSWEQLDGAQHPKVNSQFPPWISAPFFPLSSWLTLSSALLVCNKIFVPPKSPEQGIQLRMMGWSAGKGLAGLQTSNSEHPSRPLWTFSSSWCNPWLLPVFFFQEMTSHWYSKRYIWLKNANIAT